MRQIISLNRKWAFTKDENQNPAAMPQPAYWVNVPHSWNAIDGQDGGGDYDRRTCWYMREIDWEDIPEADRYYIEINGANASADLYIGGKKIAHHDGGYSTWRVDATEQLKESRLIAISVDNSENDHVYPQMADFTFYGGLYRDVNLICVSESHFDLEHYGGPGLAVTPRIQGRDAQVDIDAYVTNPQSGQRLRFRICQSCGKVNDEKEVPVSTLSVTLGIKDVRLWHGRKDPYLYTATVELLEDGRVIDAVKTRFGCRSFEIDPQRGFILNGEEYPLRGVSRHQDRWGVGNALLPEHHEEDMAYIRELGATSIRLAHYQHDQYFYDLCDEYGMVVWAEIPYISGHMENGVDNTIAQMKELIFQNYNHPSIVVWGLSNEITMKGADSPSLIQNHQLLNDLCHELDKTRLTTMAIVSMCDQDAAYIKIPDTVAWNHYFGWYGGDTGMNGPWLDAFHAKHPAIPVGLSEYGCEALNWHTSDPKQGDYTEEYQAYYHEELIKQLFTRKYLWATYVWNMFDFGADARNEGGENGQNHKGLMTFDRKYKKDAFYAYKAWLSDEPFVHLCGKRYVDRVEDVTKVTVYSNQPEVELFADGVSLGRQRSDVHFFYFDVPNKGETRLKAIAGSCADESIIRKVDAFNESYRLREKGAILNWFDITAPEGYFSLNDKLSDIMANPQGMQLFGGILQQMVKSGGKKSMLAGFDLKNSPGLMQMMGGFTIIRMVGLMGAAGVKMTREELLSLNAMLNKIPKG